MEFTADNLEKAVSLFYRSEAVQQAQAHQWLTDAQCCPQAWSFVWELLQPHRSSEVQFFAATTLHTKVLRYWKEVPVDQYEALKKQILDAIVNYAMGPKIVLNRLCITLSAYILYTIPTHWPNAFSDIITSFQPYNLPNIQPERVVWILLEILTLVPEEFQSMNFTTAQKNTVRIQLHAVTKDVLRVSEMCLASSSNNFSNNTNLTTLSNSMRCANAWFQFGGVMINECESLLSHILDICCNCYWSYDEPDSMSSDELELIEASLESYTTMLCHPSTDKYPKVVTSHLEKMMNKIIKIIQTERERKIVNMNIQVPFYGLVITAAETHIKIILKNLLQKGTSECELSLWIIHTILLCTNTPGSNPVDEECSTLTFGFWYMLQDEILGLEPKQRALCINTVKPFYSDLISILLQKSMLPSNDDDPKWTSESKEILRCHRQDIADTIMYSCEILSGDLLTILNVKLHEAIDKCTDNGKIVPDNWPYIEACLHAYFAIAEHFENEKSEHLVRLMEVLKDIPYADLHTKVLSTSLDIIGAYASWINENPYVLRIVVPLLLLGLQNADVAPSATMALKDISNECQNHIVPYSTLILETIQSALQSGRLRISENTRLMFTVGKVLSVLHIDTIMEFLNIILTPILEEINRILMTEQITVSSKSVLLVKLKMLSMLFSTLDTNFKEDEHKPTPNCPQPLLLVLQKTMPLFINLADKLSSEIEIMEVICSALKCAVITLLDECKPIVNELLQLLVSSYRIKPLCPALDVSKQLMLMFGKDNEYSQLMHYLLCELINVTLNLCGDLNVSQMSNHADILEAFFNFLTQLLKKNPELLFREGVNPTALFQCAIVCVGLPEISVVKASVSFLVKLISHSREFEPLVTLLHTYGEMLLIKVMLCIGGESSRYGVDPLSDILLILNKKYCDCLTRWLNVNMANEGFPSVIPTAAQKEQFVKSVLREKANKRKLQEIVREFSLLCRGLIGTEYGHQTTPFL